MDRPYRRYECETVRAKLPPREACLLVGALLQAGYGLTLQDVKRATGYKSDTGAWNILRSASRALRVVSVLLPDDEVEEVSPGPRPLIWYGGLPDPSPPPLSPRRQLNRRKQ